MTLLAFLAAVTLAIALAAALSARRRRAGKHTDLFHDFWANLGRALSDWRYAWALPLALTLAFALTPLDREAQRLAHQISPFDYAFWRAWLDFGNWWHVLAGMLLFFIGIWKRRTALRRAGAALIQALLVSTIVVNWLKLLSGRRGPLKLGAPDTFPIRFLRSDNPLDFAFDFWNHTLADGRFFWPSGHTASAFAAAAALVYALPEQKWLPWLVYPLAAAMGLAMVHGDFHWAGDVVAGAPLGWVIGRTAGRSLRKRMPDPKTVRPDGPGGS
jgi:membrane-associated phospholipid phosphatase